MDTREYLNNLGWDANKWTVKTEEEWLPLKDHPHAMNNMYDQVKDPTGKKLFGKNARIVEMEWFAKNAPSAPVKEEPKPEPVPEAPKPAAAIPPPPPAPPISDSRGPEPSAPKKEWDSFVKTRVANLIAAGWEKVEGQDILKKGVEELYYSDIENLDNNAYSDLIKVQEEAPKKEPGQERLNFRLDILKKRGLEVDFDNKTVTDDEGEVFPFDTIRNLSDEEWQEVTVYYVPAKIQQRKEARLKKEQETDKVSTDADKLKKLQEEEKRKRETVAEAEKERKRQHEENEKALKKEASKEAEKAKKAVEDGPRAATEEKTPEKKEPSLAEQTKFRRQALKAAGWGEESSEGETTMIVSPHGTMLSFKEVLDMPEAKFKELLSEKVEEAPKKEESKPDKPETPKEEPKKQRSPKPDTSDLETATKEEMEEATERVIKANQKSKKVEVPETYSPFERSRDDIAFEIMLKMVSPTSKKGAESIAKFAYELADEMIKQKK